MALEPVSTYFFLLTPSVHYFQFNRCTVRDNLENVSTIHIYQYRVKIHIMYFYPAKMKFKNYKKKKNGIPKNTLCAKPTFFLGKKNNQDHNT